MIEYNIKLSGAQTQLLWACIQKALLPREATNELAEVVQRQIDEQNKLFAEQANADAASKGNGADKTVN